jgi:sugar (pentulose or hexulose) kinase
MANTPLILAIDNGTQSVRALLFDQQGNLHGKGKQEIEPYFSEHPGWAEQHPDYFWPARRSGKVPMRHRTRSPA